MCFNEEASVAIYVLGCLGALYAWKSKSPVATFTIAAVTQIQLLEYLMWSDQSCGDVNTGASYAVIWVLFLHVACVPLVARKVNDLGGWAVYFIPAVITAAWALGAGLLTRDCREQPELCSTKGDGDRLQWASMTVLYDKSSGWLFYTIIPAYFVQWLYTYSILYRGYVFRTTILMVLAGLALGLAIVLSVHWGGGNWFDIFGSMWCTFSAVAGIISMVYYGIHGEGPTWHYLISCSDGYKEDHLSLVTFHTLLHIGSGYAIGAISHYHDQGVQASALTVLAFLLGWEVFEYWHAPSFGYWTVMNAGNSAMDIATGLWPFMAAAGWEWPLIWTYLLIVPGAVLGHMVRCKPYDNPTRRKYTGTGRGCLMCMYWPRKWLYDKGLLVGIKKFDEALFKLDPYMAPSRAHRVLGYCSALAVLLAVFVPEQAVACLASFTFGYALGGPSIVDEKVYDNWYLRYTPVAAVAPPARKFKLELRF